MEKKSADLRWWIPGNGFASAAPQSFSTRCIDVPVCFASGSSLDPCAVFPACHLPDKCMAGLVNRRVLSIGIHQSNSLLFSRRHRTRVSQPQAAGPRILRTLLLRYYEFVCI